MKNNELLQALQKDVEGTLSSLGLTLPEKLKSQELLKLVDGYVTDYSLPRKMTPELRTFLVALLQKLFGVAYLRLDQVMKFYHKSDQFFKDCPLGDIPLYGNSPKPVRNIDTDEVLQGDMLMVTRSGYAGVPFFLQGPLAVTDAFVFLPEFSGVDCRFAYLFMTYYKRHYKKYIYGTGVAHIRSEYVKQAKVPVLELPKQLEIVKRVFSIHQAKQLAEKNLADVKQMKVGRLQEAMEKVKDMRKDELSKHIDDLTADLKGTCKKHGFTLPELTAAELDSLSISLQQYCNGEELTEFPLAKKVKSVNGKPLKVSEQELSENRVLKAFVDLVVHFDKVVELPVDLAAKPFTMKRVVQSQTPPGNIEIWASSPIPVMRDTPVFHEGEAVIVTCKGNVGVAIYSANPKVACDNAPVEPRPELSDARFLLYSLRAKERIFRARSAATTIPQLRSTTVYAEPILVPALSVQQELARELTHLDETEAYLKQLVTKCNDFFNSRVNETFVPLDLTLKNQQTQQQ